MDTNYPDQITIDVEARLHLQHVDIQESDHYIQEVSGTVISYPNAGSYEVSLSPAKKKGEKMYFKLKSFYLVITSLLLLLFVSCEKEISPKEENLVLRGEVLEFLDQCHGNQVIISVDTSFNVGSYSYYYDANIIAIPQPGRVMADENGEFQLIGYNYLYNGKPTGLPIGGTIIFEARPYNPSTGDTIMFQHNTLCPYFPLPYYERYVVTNLLLVSE